MTERGKYQFCQGGPPHLMLQIHFRASVILRRPHVTIRSPTNMGGLSPTRRSGAYDQRIEIRHSGMAYSRLSTCVLPRALCSVLLLITQRYCCAQHWPYMKPSMVAPFSHYQYWIPSLQALL
jgi:hypothetical protein